MGRNYTIALLPKERFIGYYTRKVGENLNKKYTFNDYYIARPTHSLVTENASTTSIVNINLDKCNCLLQLAPQLNNTYSRVERGLANCLNELIEVVQRPKGNISALITGGEWRGNSDNNSLMSIDLMSNIAKFFDEKGIPISIIFGKHNNQEYDNAFTTGYITTLWNKLFNSLNLNPGASKEQIAKELENIYEVVEIAPEHNLRFNEITSEIPKK